MTEKKLSESEKKRVEHAEKVAEEFKDLFNRLERGEELTDDDIEHLIEDTKYIADVYEGSWRSKKYKPELHELMRIIYIPDAYKCVAEPVASKDGFIITTVKCYANNHPGSVVTSYTPISQAFTIMKEPKFGERYEEAVVFDMVPLSEAASVMLGSAWRRASLGGLAILATEILGELFDTKNIEPFTVNGSKEIKCNYFGYLNEYKTAVLWCPTGDTDKYVVISPKQVYMIVKRDGEEPLVIRHTSEDVKPLVRFMQRLFHIAVNAKEE